ncbi:MAG: threonine synthase [Armatimonadetes bacterium]|nr:threonine synthase [Armatimonadota bacterium]
MSYWQGLIHRYGPSLNIDGVDRPVSLHEGNTPLIPAPKLAEAICPGAEIFLKYEGLNPTGSFKDRGMTTAITHAQAQGAKAVVCASTGNTAASAAAYAARAGMKCLVIIPDGKIALGKLAGAIAYGATVVAIDGSFDDALNLVRDLESRIPIAVVNSVNPARLEGQKTAAWEVEDQLGRVPDWLSLPVGNAGNISAYWLGFIERGGARPRLLGTQAAGAAPLVLGHPVEKPETKATAIRIGKPARGDQALAAIRQSNGILLAASDEEIFDAYRLVSRLEGVFCEPSSAAGIAGLKRTYADHSDEFKGKQVVCVLTGNGLKDPDSVFEQETHLIRIPNDIESLVEVAR